MSVNSPQFNNLVIIMKRIHNILDPKNLTPLEDFDASRVLPYEKEEVRLINAWNIIIPLFDNYIKKEDYVNAGLLYGPDFLDLINNFLDNVKVNASDPLARMDRLMVLKSIYDAFTNNIADLTLIEKGK